MLIVENYLIAVLDISSKIIIFTHKFIDHDTKQIK